MGMPEPDREFQQRLLATFRGEAEEHVRAISGGLIDLENTPGAQERAPIVEKVFREAHSLKGAARAVNLKEIETICQSTEGILAQAKRREIALTADALDVLHHAMDEIERLLTATRGERPEQGPSNGANLLSRLEAITRGSAAVELSGQPDVEVALRWPEAEKKVAEETVRIPVDQLDRLFLQVEELVPASMGAAHRSAALRELAREVSLWKREWAKVQFVERFLQQSIDRDGGTLDKRVFETRRLLDFLEWNDEFVMRFGTRLNGLSRSAERDTRSLSSMVDSLLRDTKLLLLRPFSSLTEAFPKLVRDLCRQQGKEASLSVRGADVEIDRRILQEIKDPLIHLVRNCIDHGIEKPEERAHANKAPRGTVTIAIDQKSANRVEIAVSDDGAGIDPQRVRDAVVKSGLVSAEFAQAIGDSEILAFIFQSGVSTSPIVTDISGRGLGMAIVREKVERLGGEVTLDTRLGVGTTFRLLLPLTVSTIRGLLIRVGELSFIIPVTFVERVASSKRDSIQTVENRATVLLGGQAVSFVRLHEVLGLPADGSGGKDSTSLSMVVLAASERRIAFQVDEVVGEQEVLVKSLGPQLVRVRNVGGAAVLGTGMVVPILNAVDLMKTAVKTAFPPAPVQEVKESTAPQRRSILVVDDSITARTLLKSILEAAGYLVRTAVDGAEAFATLRETEFDLVVSDVDMPRLNGFDLTAKIRADKGLTELPVILVTALESREDRERGIDVGANAYIVKSSFEQSNLLDVVRRYD
jgi:two-component system chemotaxis sensor kinase CheA